MTALQKPVHSTRLRFIPLSLPTISPLENEETQVARPPFMDNGNIKGPPSSTLAEPQPTLPLVFGRRCHIRGCVFEVCEPAKGICWIHALQEKEPEKFHTLQPSHRVLEMAKYGITTEDEDTRVRQKLRAAAVRRTFLEGVLK